MASPKPKFKVGDAFFLPKEAMFVQIDKMEYFEGEGRGWLYNLKCYKHAQDEAKPWKRYYEERVINELLPMRQSKAMKVLYGTKAGL